jgi:ribosomal peptide maturation radical SAM protein 1
VPLQGLDAQEHIVPTVGSEQVTYQGDCRHDWSVMNDLARPLRVALVTMPWAQTEMPSIQCGLLKAEVGQCGHEVDVYYLNLELAALVGPELYELVSRISANRQYFLGEWLFGGSAYADPPDASEYFDHFPDLLETLSRHSVTITQLNRLRDEILPGWIADHAQRITDSGYAVIGFSSMFEQNVACLALARHIKLISPEVVVVFGGANFDGEMGQEYLRVLPFIDYAITGEADLSFPAFLACLAGKRSPEGLPGVWCRRDGDVVGEGTGQLVQDMDALPVPDFDDYFATLHRLGRRNVLSRPERLVFEASRGCWWGEKHHCTFCGLNALGMKFRSKSADRVFGELTELARKYQINRIEATDNILDMGYLTTLCHRLRGAPWDPSLFFEIKANLTRPQIRLLRESGIERIQPGIESLSTHVLGLMRKGSTMLINVNLLKWARFYAIDAAWGIITGFPGEHDADYEEQIELIPSLYHLPPPLGTEPVWLERFSPYYTDDFPIHDVRPREAYSFIYPVAGIDLNRIAYFFDYAADGIASADAHLRLEKAVEQWQARWETGPPPVLLYTRGPDWLSIKDTRGQEQRQITMSGWKADVYQYCGDKSRSHARIREFLGAARPDISDADINRFLRTCMDTRIMVSENDRYLSLALPRPEVSGHPLT